MSTDLLELLKTSLLILGALFPIVNPLGGAPIFLTLTEGLPSASRKVLARQIAINGFLLLIGSIFIGTHILAFFGISLPVVQVGGGMVVIATSWKLLQRKDEDMAHDEEQRQASCAELERQAFYPLTLPLTVGPGSISVAITVGANHPAGRQSHWPIIVASIIGPALIALTIFLSYRYAENIARAIGETAMNVILRLSSFILLCIGVQILWNGVHTLLRQ